MRCSSTSKNAPFSSTATELPGTTELRLSPASEWISWSIGESLSILSFGSW